MSPALGWHAWIGDATVADAILDRLMLRQHRITLTGDSLRQENQQKGEKHRPIVTDAVRI